MRYIVTKRFKTQAICGEVNLPAMTECQLNGVMLTYKGKPLCVATSENAHQYFARNDDGNGMERGDLLHAIQSKLTNNQPAWDKVWADKRCQKYKRKEHADHWLWNHDFYNADIDTLKYIAQLVGA